MAVFAAPCRAHAVSCRPVTFAPVRAAMPIAERRRVVVRSAEAAVATDVANKVHVVDADSYHRFLEENAERLVVVDVYTDWCGPCKIIAPEVDKMAVEYPDVAFAKLNAGANDATKRLAISLGIKALPTFYLYRNSKKQDEMTGAKIANLRALVSKHK